MDGLVDAELVATIEELVVACLAELPGGGKFDEVLARVARQRGEPESQHYSDEAEQQRFYRLCSATAEAVWRLIGTGIVVPTDGAIEQRFASEIGRVVGPQAVAVAPNMVRLSTAGREWLASGELVIRNPDLFLSGMPELRRRVRRCLREAVDAYRRELPLACVILLGAASEAAWNDVARAISEAWPNAARIPSDVGPAAKQDAVSAILKDLPRKRRSQVFQAIEQHPDFLGMIGRFYVEQRNYAVHEDEPEIEVGMHLAATLLYYARDYFTALATLSRVIQEGDAPPSAVDG